MMSRMSIGTDSKSEMARRVPGKKLGLWGFDAVGELTTKR
jgi:hypothetical protein